MRQFIVKDAFNVWNQIEVWENELANAVKNMARQSPIDSVIVTEVVPE